MLYRFVSEVELPDYLEDVVCRHPHFDPVFDVAALLSEGNHAQQYSTGPSCHTYSDSCYEPKGSSVLRNSILPDEVLKYNCATLCPIQPTMRPLRGGTKAGPFRSGFFTSFYISIPHLCSCINAATNPAPTSNASFQVNRFGGDKLVRSEEMH